MPNHSGHENPKYTNRLINEKSPYLLQHAHNPVDWFPWGEEAFAKAKRENKPVLVSIGYSTCHWCHVMEDESFEDKDVAKTLNDKFVAIKVDREERPDIDAIYMKVCQALTGQGGWPLNVFLTPDQKPFYAGTYFPKLSRFGRPGFIDVLNQLYEQYDENHEKVVRVSENIVQSLSKMDQQGGQLTNGLLHKTFEHFSKSFDERYGGFGNAPKFPSPHQLMYLLRYHVWQENDDALAMVMKTLDAMADGGIYDHIGYGFSRYSVDEKWLVPHFEKMLYDNAMLAISYTEAHQVLGNTRYKNIVEEIMTYVTRDMLDPLGGFYSAEDADSEGVEGKFYLWEPDEIYEVLGDDLGDLFCRAYDISRTGNFEGLNIPNLIERSLQQVAMEENIAIEVLMDQLEEAKIKLFSVRKKRIHPHKDDKILTSWNALMITALAKAGKVFHNEHYLHLAKNACLFIEEKLMLNGQLMARFRENEVKNEAFIDDYAFFLWALDALYDATLDPQYLEKSKRYADEMIHKFWDPDHGGFYINQHGGESLIMRPKELYDGALPSGNSVAAMVLLHLSKRTGDVTYEHYVDKMFQAFASEVEYYPAGYTFFLQAYMMTQAHTSELVVLKGENTEDYDNAIQSLHEQFLPHVMLLGGEKTDIQQVAKFIKEYQLLENKTTYYYCENFQCERPTTSFEQIKQKVLSK